jgi:hypothetical protein
MLSATAEAEAGSGDGVTTTEQPTQTGGMVAVPEPSDVPDVFMTFRVRLPF